MSYAGKNANQLKKLITYYSQSKQDSLKLKSAIFLIENMIGKGYYKLTKQTDKGINCNFEVFDPKFDFVNGIDSINILKKKYENSAKCGSIFYANPQFIEDIKTIKAEYLINNIEFAFKAWQMPWAKKLTFDQFKEFILPYRFGNEPLQNWRKEMFEKGKWIYQSGTFDRIKLASIVNDSLFKVYKWYGNNKMPYYQALLSVAQMQIVKCGTCDDLNMLVAYWLRAVGIPVASEFTTYWANSNYGGHSWLGILDTTQKFVPMNAMFDDAERDSLPFKGAHLAKAYRNLFQINPELYNKNAPPSFYMDITHDYLPVINYKMNYTSDTNRTVCIGILNGLYWKPLATETTISNNTLEFKNIARNVLYSPIIILQNNSSNTIGSQFLVTKKGQIQYINADTNHLCSIKINIGRGFPANYYNKCLKIIYWNNSLQKWVYTNSTNILKINPDSLRRLGRTEYLLFNNVPSNAIYRIIDITKDLNNHTCGRPFIFNKEENIFQDY